MDSRLSWRMPCVWLGSVGGVGFMPRAPGTYGSLVGVALAVPILWLEYGALFLLGASALAYAVGIWASHQWLAVSGADTDPAAIVIDEVAGQWLTLALIALFMPIGVVELLAGFLLFRFFDIVKPPPIGWIDRTIKGAHGIMLDDMVAGIMAAGVFLIGKTFI